MQRQSSDGAILHELRMSMNEATIDLSNALENNSKLEEENILLLSKIQQLETEKKSLESHIKSTRSLTGSPILDSRTAMSGAKTFGSLLSDIGADAVPDDINSFRRENRSLKQEIESLKLANSQICSLAEKWGIVHMDNPEGRKTAIDLSARFDREKVVYETEIKELRKVLLEFKESNGDGTRPRSSSGQGTPPSAAKETVNQQLQREKKKVIEVRASRIELEEKHKQREVELKRECLRLSSELGTARAKVSELKKEHELDKLNYHKEIKESSDEFKAKYYLQNLEKRRDRELSRRVMLAWFRVTKSSLVQNTVSLLSKNDLSAVEKDIDSHQDPVTAGNPPCPNHHQRKLINAFSEDALSANDLLTTQRDFHHWILTKGAKEMDEQARVNEAITTQLSNALNDALAQMRDQERELNILRDATPKEVVSEDNDKLLKSVLGDVQEQLSLANSRNEFLSKELYEANTNLEDLTETLKKVRNDVEIEREGWERERESIQEGWDASQREVESFSSRIASLVEDVDDNNNEDRINDRNITCQTDSALEFLLTERSKLEQQVVMLQNEVHSFQSTISELKLEVDCERSALESATLILSRVNEAKVLANAEIKKSKSKLEYYSVQICELEKVIGSDGPLDAAVSDVVGHCRRTHQHNHSLSLTHGLLLVLITILILRPIPLGPLLYT